MLRIRIRRSLLATLVAVVAMASITNGQESWTQWRGSDQTGVAGEGQFPVSWNEETGIDWKTAVPGKGSSTPVAAGSRAYVTSGMDEKNHLIALDTQSGKILWQTDLGPDRGNKHKKGGGSNPSPVIDGDRVYAYFRSGDLACVSTGGKILWQTNLQDRFGEDTLWWDLGSSPMLTESAVVVAVMQTGPSYLVAFDKTTGDVIWKEDRMLGAPEEAAQSYSTPIAVSIDNHPAIAVMGADHLTLHDAATGKTIGKLGGFNPTEHKYFRSISSPVAEGNIVVCPYSRGETVTAVRMDALVAGKGKEAIAWFRDDLGSDVPTPAALNGRVYLVGDGKTSRGKVWCLDVNSGATLWSLDLPKSRISYSSSPLIAGDHLYITGEDATTHVVGPLGSESPKVVATNPLSDDEPFTVASPVPDGDAMMIRSKSNVYRITGK
ncbi:outer membrane biogenesis protein BamB [Rubripirellula tenax]|uniref:Outer membrane biogenesis protein BamB n=1 Tax=Rubripirellula tenax TaxID=2528015 RepID=A0A5C6FB36_9BACT|nr:PQQ-binding-like beta-propeller repeat protein [Rubripirellula tenax]TWU56799.1 outer membrane biogenesis protein BamB [Rubripirellula tenax]